MFGQGTVGRQVGVVAPSARPDDAPTQRLLSFQPCHFVAVEYGDAQGTKHVGVLMHMGGQWYMPPNAESWAQSVRTVAPWLSAQLDQELSKFEAKNESKDGMNAPVPTHDAVDIFPAGKRTA